MAHNKSFSVIETKSILHKFSIVNFLYILPTPGTSVRCQPFSAQGTLLPTFQLEVYPYGKNQNNRQYISIQLHCTQKHNSTTTATGAFGKDTNVHYTTHACNYTVSSSNCNSDRRTCYISVPHCRSCIQP